MFFTSLGTLVPLFIPLTMLTSDGPQTSGVYLFPLGFSQTPSVRQLRPSRIMVSPFSTRFLRERSSVSQGELRVGCVDSCDGFPFLGFSGVGRPLSRSRVVGITFLELYVSCSLVLIFPFRERHQSFLMFPIRPRRIVLNFRS